MRSDPDNIIMLRPSYYSEISVILRHMSSLGLRNIGVIYQNDEYGISCFNDLSDIYSKNNYSINIIPATFERSSTYLYDTYKKILDDQDPFIDSYKRNSAALNIDAILLIGTSAQEIQVINYFKKLKPSMYFYNISFIGENIEKLKNLQNKSNIYITSPIKVDSKTFPILYNNLIKEMRLTNDKNKILDISLIFDKNLIEGFIAGMFTANILKKINRNKINRKAFIEQLYYENENYIEVFDMKLGPFISSKISRGLHTIYLSKYDEKTNKYNVISETKETDT